MSCNAGKVESLSDPSPPRHRRYCSFAVTRRNTVYQAIFACRSCSTRKRASAKLSRNGQEKEQAISEGDEAETQLDCLCQACAETCHADHDGLEYVGFGPAYCDCHDMTLIDSDHGGDVGIMFPVCQLAKSSNEVATRLNVALYGGVTKRSLDRATASSGAYRIEAFVIEELLDPDLSTLLRESACELVKRSKNTFWLEPGSETTADLCDLERLAHAVYQQHCAASSSTNRFRGAEWWVQVKHPLASGTSASQNPLESEAVDLHYDKDEVVSELFGLGVFPELSTVTYFTPQNSTAPPQHRPQAPTLVLSKRYEGDPCERKPVDMLISHPRRGKHLLFDGRLLHGAPTHLALREATIVGCDHQKTLPLAGDVEPRVTLLVNLWSNHKPAGVESLPSDIRRDLIAASMRSSGEPPSCTDPRLTFQPLPVAEIAVSSADDLVSDEPLYLPFVSRNATWSSTDDDADDYEELYLSMLVPRHIKHSPFHTILFHFDAIYGPALLPKDDHEDDECEGQERL